MCVSATDLHSESKHKQKQLMHIPKFGQNFTIIEMVFTSLKIKIKVEIKIQGPAK